ncbi:unnamed protein product [Mytilus coruscus]|uniref:Uncharacterized protein n=1 Tax=Mytilus coruscus TaxID=42192 RepID=A0A6J8DBE4_MYTCO|nr:unnamed protein product [Mytilus coruscus]
MDIYNKSVTIMKFLTCCLSFLCHLTEIEAFQCYSCSYSLTGDPTLHYECVNAPRNVTMGTPIVQCSTGLCITKAVYQLGTLKVWSADRACRNPEVIDCGENCCAENSHNIVCQFQCSGVGNTVCNNLNINHAELRLTTSSNKTAILSELEKIRSLNIGTIMQRIICSQIDGVNDTLMIPFESYSR